ncbi:MAG: ABC transporter permease [Rhodospirillales bacterium]
MLVIQNYCNFWSISTFILAATLIGPFAALIILSTGDSGGLWEHLLSTVVPRYTVNTLFLMAGVGFFSLLFGISTAWIIARFKFLGSRILDWSLLLPCTVPSYIIAYTYTDLLEYAGPVQSLLRNTFGWSSAQDYWFPEIRSMGGAILVMSSVLFPLHLFISANIF